MLPPAAGSPRLPTLAPTVFVSLKMVAELALPVIPLGQDNVFKNSLPVPVNVLATLAYIPSVTLDASPFKPLGASIDLVKVLLPENVLLPEIV